MEIIIKLDREEPVKVKTSSIYGDLVTPGDMYPDIGNYVYGSYDDKLNAKIDRLKMDLQNRDDEIQDLKLENDRLKKREEILMHFLHSCRCDLECQKCMFAKNNRCVFPMEVSGTHWKLMEFAVDTFKKLEDL